MEDNTCQNINECTDSLVMHECPNNSTCEDKDGGYDCICNSGYEKDTDLQI